MTKPEIAQKMSELVKEKDLLEVKKKVIANEYNDKIKGVEGQITELADKYLNDDDQFDVFDQSEDAEYTEEEGETKQLNSGLELPMNANAPGDTFEP